MNRQDPSVYVLIATLGSALLFGIIGALSTQPGPPVPWANWLFDNTAGQSPSKIAEQSASAVTDAAATSTTASLSADQWLFGASETCHITGEARVRNAPSGSAELLTEVSRGAVFSCRRVTNKDGWFIIDDGPYAGAFVADTAVSQSAVPSLDTRYSGSQTIRRAGYLFAAPDPGARVLQTLQPPLILSIVGKSANSMLEIRLKSGGAGYVLPEIFTSDNKAITTPSPNSTSIPARAQRTANYQPVNNSEIPSSEIDRSAPVRLKNEKAMSEMRYPENAYRNRQGGTVSFEATVSPDGRVTDCRVTGSSGVNQLDEATCREFRRIARFEPARDSDGNFIAASYNKTVRWKP